MPAGKLFLASKPKKKVLSNKSLTQRVRALGGTEGDREMRSETVENATTLTANTANINYIDIVETTSELLHSVRLFISMVAPADGISRVIIFEDGEPALTETPASLILSNVADVFSSYITSVHPFATKRTHKNFNDLPRVRILRDFAISQSLQDSSERWFKIVTIPMYGRKLQGRLGIGILTMSSVATVVDIQVNTDVTDLTGV